MLCHVVFDCDGTLVDTSSAKYSLYPSIKTILTELSQVAVLSVWTARDRVSTLRILSENQVSQFFEAIYSSDDAYPKPHVKGLLELTYGSDKSKVFVIGDSRMDIMGAKNFGAKAIGALWNGQTHQTHLLEAGADFLAATPKECLDWIKTQLQDS
jgi:phosphoglycolate phosphatase-like HAD superfamily hydrolase